MSKAAGPDYAALLKRALVAIDELEAKLAQSEGARAEPIAVVGIGCRLPGGVEGPEDLWRLLAAGTDAVTEVPRDRWDAQALYDPDPDAIGKSYSKWGAFLKGVELFDAPFFGISGREAESLDPQQRLLLEVTWHALEHAGIAPTSLAGGDAGVYVGISTTDYSIRMAMSGRMREMDAYSSSGTAHSVAAGRIAYFLGTHGPNFPVDTACSSSLVAVHLAVQGLRNRETSLALAGGVNLTLLPEGSIITSRGRMMSFTGRCKTYDASADGYVRGEGCAMLVMKRLSDARRDGDRIVGVIRGSAINQDGRSSGLTAPNGKAQVAVIRAALANAGVEPAQVGYLEAHGTGTSLGDPIEMKALGEVFRDRAGNAPLMVGSIKTNLGHLEAAAGVAGLIKAVLAIERGTVPAHLHLKNPNPMIAWDQLPVRVPTEPTPFARAADAPRRAGVSSFGFSGTNAHVVLEQAPVESPRTEPDEARAQLLAISAEGVPALRELAGRYADALSSPASASLRATARSAAVGRAHLATRLAVVATGPVEAARRLREFASGELSAGVAHGTASRGMPPEIVFIFTGQGAQFPGMGMGLYATQPAYREALDECARLLAPHLDRPLLDLLKPEGDAGALEDTRHAQPALFAVEYSLARLWRSWGVEPTVVMGHSVGELVAACVAGVFSLEDGLRLVAARGRLMSGLPRDGGMAAVFADESRVRAALQAEASVAIAGCNGERNTVISGENAALERVIGRLAADGVEAQRLKVSHAFHSPLMDPILDEFERIAAGVRFSPPTIGLVSNVTGRMAGAEILSPGYWRRHVREAVRFAQSLGTLAREGLRVLLEVGPHPVLAGMAQREASMADAVVVGSLRRGRDDEASMLEALAQLHVRGMPLPERALWGERARKHRIDLPSYPFQRVRCWLDVPDSPAAPALALLRHAHPLLDGAMPSALAIYESRIGAARPPWLRDHRVLDFTPLPAAAFLEIALVAGRESLALDAVEVRDLALREALMLPEEGTVTLQAIVSPTDGGAQRVAVHSRESGDGPWRLHATAIVARAAAASALPRLDAEARAQARPIDAQAYYALMDAHGQAYGPAFRGIAEIRRAGPDIHGRVELPEGLDAARMQLHPALLDACLQLMGVPLIEHDPEGERRYMPVGVERMRVHRAGARRAWCRVRTLETGSPDMLRSDIALFDESGGLIAELEGVEMRRVSREALAAAGATAQAASWCFDVHWRELAPDPASQAHAQGRWLVLCDEGGVGDALAARLRQDGAEVTCVRAAQALPDCGLAEGGPFEGIVLLWALDASSTLDARCVEAGLPAALARMLQAAQALGESSARLWVATRGAQSVSGSVADPLQSALWGLAGVIASEYPSTRCVRVDLDPAAMGDAVARLHETICHADDERRVAWRGATRLCARLQPATLAAAEPGPNLRLEIPARGSLANLVRLEVAREPPGSGEVEVRVHATGLNFRDVLNVLGMYPGDPGPLGNECSGVVTALGPGVTGLAVGDRVVCMTDRSFATWVTVSAVLCTRLPGNMTFAAAATVPVAFLTADHSLHTLGRIGRGTRVLIHAVTGGVGMAAAQLCRVAGAEVFGTASAGKRALAATLAQHVSDSRSFAFVDDFRRATAGEGVDVVLNSLAGEFIPATLGLLRTGGRFIEIGKSDDWDAARVAAQFPSIEYTRLYLGELAAADPAGLRGRLERLLEEMAAARLAPLPHRVYPIERAQEAFRLMAQGQHVGKLVIEQPVAPVLRADATYLVTGGLGGLGLAAASWLAAQGARNLVLVGRSAPGVEAQAAIERLRAQGVTVHVGRADVGDRAQLARVIDHVTQRMPPLRGILHAAGTVDDGLLAELDMARFAAVLSPKVRGTWNLHELTLGTPLDFFVLYSSGAALLGAAGQGNYAAANSFMDGFAHMRRSMGLPALSVNWGNWTGTGMAARVGEEHHRRWAAAGLRPIEPAQGAQMLGAVLRGAPGAQVAAIPLARSRMPAGLEPFYSELRVAAAAAPAAAAPVVDMRREMSDTQAHERPAKLQAFLSEQLVKVLALGSGTQVDVRRSVMEMGLDSLMAMDLRNRIEASLGVRLSVAGLMRGPSIAELAEETLGELGLASAGSQEREELSL